MKKSRRAAVIVLAAVMVLAIMPAASYGVTKLSVPSGLSLTENTSTSLKVSWKTVTGAAGYQLYRSTSLFGTYRRVLTTTKTSTTQIGLTAGRTYYYKVRAFRKTADARTYGKFSSVKVLRLTYLKPHIQVTMPASVSSDGKFSFTLENAYRDSMIYLYTEQKSKVTAGSFLCLLYPQDSSLTGTSAMVFQYDSIKDAASGAVYSPEEVSDGVSYVAIPPGAKVVITGRYLADSPLSLKYNQDTDALLFYAQYKSSAYYFVATDSEEVAYIEY